MSKLTMEWDGTVVRTWLESRIAAAKADQVAAERYGRERQDDCDVAAAEEMVGTLLKAILYLPYPLRSAIQNA